MTISREIRSTDGPATHCDGSDCPTRRAGRPLELFLATEGTADTRPAFDVELVRRLVDAQFPQWAELPLRLLDPAGSDHVIYRLGEELSVRLPRHAGAIGQAKKESEWLPRLAPHLPLAVPVPVGVGEPDFGYPWPWGVSRWLDGEVATAEALGGSPSAAVELAEFLTALQQWAPADFPVGDVRGDLTARPLADRDRATRAAIAEVDGVFGTAAMTELWDAALSAPRMGSRSGLVPRRLPHRQPPDRRRPPQRGHRLRRTRHRRPGVRLDHRFHPDVGREPDCLPGRARRGRRHVDPGPHRSFAAMT